MATVGQFFAVIWMLPVMVPIWVLFIFPAWALGWIAFIAVHPTAVEFMPLFHGRPSWWWSVWEGVGGLSLAGAVLVRDVRSLNHELRHGLQWMVLGPLFPVVYLGLLLVFGYLPHPLERDARRHG